MGTHQHKQNTPEKLKIGILSISSTRSLATDKSGIWISKRAKKEGHLVVCHKVIPDQAAQISEEVNNILFSLSPHAILITGGTGISKKDVTIAVDQESIVIIIVFAEPCNICAEFINDSFPSVGMGKGFERFA